MNFTKGDIDGVRVIELARHEDARGHLIETLRQDELPQKIDIAMSYVSFTLPGKSRGPHEHREQTDLFAFTGPGSLKLVLWDNRRESPTYGKMSEHTLGDRKPATVIVPPGVVHAYVNVSDEPAMVINYPDRLYRGKGKGEPVDEIRHEDAPESPFKL